MWPVYSICSFFIFLFNLESINQNCSWCQHLSAVYTCWTRVVWMGLTLQTFVFDVGVSVCMFCIILCIDWLCRFVYRKGWHMRRVSEYMCICLWQSLVVLRWAYTVNRMLKSSCWLSDCNVHGQNPLQISLCIQGGNWCVLNQHSRELISAWNM